MASLYQLTSNFEEVLSMLTDPEVDPQAVEDTLESITAEIEVKADGYAAVLRQLEGELKLWKDERNFIEERISIRENNILRMKEAVKKAMIVSGTDKIAGQQFTWKLVNNGGMQPMVVDGDVPDEYLKVIYETDKDKIRKALDEGKKLDFAHYEPRGKHITIK